MPKPLSIALLHVLVVLLFGCNKPSTKENSDSFNPSTQGTETAKIFPHSEEFKKVTHGSVYLQNRALCVNCHGSDASGGVAKVSCTQCHASYPHPTDWAIPQKHGPVAIDKSKLQNCMGCHTAGKTTGAVACQTCHAAFPHEVDDYEFAHGDMARTYAGKCTICHTDINKIINHPEFEKGCRDCHETGKITIEWMDQSTSNNLKPRRDTASKIIKAVPKRTIKKSRQDP